MAASTPEEPVVMRRLLCGMDGAAVGVGDADSGTSRASGCEGWERRKSGC
jgi:hypothetical protein